MITTYLDWAVIGAVVYAYSLLSERLKSTPFTGAVVFLITGLLLGPQGLGWMTIKVNSTSLSMIAEFTLALILFTDAAHANLKVLGESRRLPIRLLAVGLPLTIALGAVVAHRIFPDFSWIEAAILAIVLAPTDAALGQPVVTNPVVPANVREDLGAESGLNDGICVPVLLCLLSLARGSQPEVDGALLLARFFLQQVGLGLLVGLGLTAVGCLLRNRALARGSMAPDWKPVLAVALPVGCFALAQQIGGSGFIACFSAGMAMGAWTGAAEKDEQLVAAQATGDVLSLITWVAFGSAAVVGTLAALSPAMVLYGVLSLTVIRMLPVALATTGQRLPIWTMAFVGWFGPRGLASIVFAVIVLESGLPHGQVIVGTASFTILLSVLAHGMSAPSLVGRYGRWAQRHGLADG